MNGVTFTFEGKVVTLAEFWSTFHQRRAEREVVETDVEKLERDIIAQEIGDEVANR
jgi:hypothetical protein